MNVDDARSYLKQIKGVGNKVADCVLLYAFSKFDCFPTDIWIKKTLQFKIESFKIRLSIFNSKNQVGKFLSENKGRNQFSLIV